MAQAVKPLPAMRRPGWIPGQEDSPGEGNENPLQYCCLKNSMAGGAWWATVRGVAELDVTERLHFHFHFMEAIRKGLCFSTLGILVENINWLTADIK